MFIFPTLVSRDFTYNFYIPFIPLFILSPKLLDSRHVRREKVTRSGQYTQITCINQDSLHTTQALGVKSTNERLSRMLSRACCFALAAILAPQPHPTRLPRYAPVPRAPFRPLLSAHNTKTIRPNPPGLYAAFIAMIPVPIAPVEGTFCRRGG